MPPATCGARRVSRLSTDPQLRFLRLLPEPRYSQFIHRGQFPAFWNHPSRNVWDCLFWIWQAASEGGRIPTSCRKKPPSCCPRRHPENLIGEGLKSKGSDVLRASPRTDERRGGWTGLGGARTSHSEFGEAPSPSPACLSSPDCFPRASSISQ